MKNFTQNSIIIIMAILLIHQFEDKRAVQKTSKHNESVLLDSISYYKNSLGQEVAEKKSFQGTAQELKQILDAKRKENAQLNEALKKWRKVINISDTQTETRIDSIKVPFEVRVPCDFSRTWIKKEKFYSVAGEVNELGVTIENILIPNQQTIVVGTKKLGMFKTEFRAEITNSNPYIKTTSIDNFTFVERKKRFGIGASFGFGFYHNGFFVGPSVNYNLIEF